MAGKTKLELTWIGKDKREQLEPRVLIEDGALGYSAMDSNGKPGIQNNLLIKGDNLLALKALESEYAGQVKCICIDPPYNTGSAFDHYDDGLEHSLWLKMMQDRLKLCARLLSEDGSVWVVVDNHEVHYLKVLMDEIFGRSNFFGEIIWQHSVQGKNDAKTISLHHNTFLVYRKSPKFERGVLPRTEEHNTNYKNPDNDPRGLWRAGDVRSPNLRENLKYEVITPSGKVIHPPEKGWRWSKATFEGKVETGEITFYEDDTKVRRKIYLCDQAGRVPESIWFSTEAGTTREATAEIKAVLAAGTNLIATPKPEALIRRVLQIATKPGDLVLDSFAGSGTAGAVAHKMGRRWIMVELGDHADDHIVPRLNKVIDGEDPGGVTEATGWKGGGGYRYYRLAPSLLEKDQWGQHVISKDYKPEMLAQAVCKLMGFTYAPNQNHFWLHGHSTESDFIYVTTQRLTHDALRKLSHEVGEGRTLLVCCRAHDENTFDNLTVRKIPHAVMAKCEWGRDDYSLNIQEAPSDQITEDDLDENDTVEAAE